MPETAAGALSLFHPLVRQWFEREVGAPTEVQERAWPQIARGAHVLVSAPTGTGKTFAAFLWAIDRLATGALPAGKVRVLYVSPLKALNNDIQRNLLSPLAGIGACFAGAGQPFPAIRALTRSGDTPSSERRRMLRQPPEILITTPESLNLILSSQNGRLMLDGIAVVILDEIHAVAGTKRGTHLASAVERIVRLSGEFQRIALSATVAPLSVVADFVGGFVVARGAGETSFRKRRVEIVHCPRAKGYEIRIEFPAAGAIGGAAGSGAAGPGLPDPMWDALARECRAIIAGGRSTLFFVNSRRHAEKLCRFINEGAPEPLAWAHHGSLSRELRLVVEQRLKRGELKAIVATSSLELGIDIGSLDRVILVQTPFTVASAVQRLGRAGHRAGAPSRGVIFPLHGRDIVEAAVMARCVRAQDIEDVAPIACPLDVLAQVIVSMTAAETWNVEELFDQVRASAPYRMLPRRQFDLVLGMLAGRYEETRLRELSPLVSVDRMENNVRAREGARIRLATSGGTIPDRGYFTLRTADSKAVIGELDEEFVWERSLGDTFVLGTQGWRIRNIGHQDVEVVPADPGTAMSPFWKAEERNRGFHLSDRISRALEEWNARLDDPGLPAELEKSHDLQPGAARAMVGFLALQRKITGTDLPHRHHLLVEHARDPATAAQRGAGGAARMVLHTLWGGRVNRPFGLALSAALEERLGFRPELSQTDDAIMVFLPEAMPAADLLGLVTAGNLERLLRARLEGSGFFGARFRESAGRALLLPRASARGRMPLWLTRLRAKTLLSAVSKYDDFPLLLEAWRTCLRDEFDMAGLASLLDELASGAIRVSETSPASPSPFCAELVWRQTNAYMYADDTPQGRGATALRADLVRELALSTELRPRIPAETAAAFQAKLQRTAEGYAPRDAREILDWLKERILVPRAEWDALLEASARDRGADRAELEAALSPKIVERAMAVCARETLPRLVRALAGADEGELGEVFSEWLRFYGPIDPGRAGEVFGLAGDRLDSLLEDLVGAEQVVLDRLMAGSDALLLCDRENLEILLRICRARARPAFRPLPLTRLPLFIAHLQGLTKRGTGSEDMKGCWERLFGFGLPARLWEEEILPARLEGYRTRWLDSLLGEAGILWLGCGKEKIAFCFGQDAELFVGRPRLPEGASGASDADALFPAATGKYAYWDLAESTKLSSAALAERLWALAWKGEVSNDSFQPVRRGIGTGFRAEEIAPREGRRSFSRWQASRPAAGFWFRVDRGPPTRDALDEEEIARDRIRQAIQRYGIVFREILECELPPLRWPRLFRSLRLMEFSGEVVSGRFFEGIPGLQFASPAALETLGKPLPDEAVFWVNAVDPASLCGIALEGLKPLLPSRLPGTHVVFHGSAVVLVSRRGARALEFRVAPDAPRLPEYLSFIREMTARDARPLASVRVETVNGLPAPRSPYKERLVEFGFVEDYRKLTYRARLP